MVTKKFIIMSLAFFLAIALVSANSYNVEYSQVNNKIVVKESVDGTQISNQLSNDFLEKSSEGYYFIKKLEFGQNYSDVEIELILDTGFTLDKENLFPTGYEIKSDGQSIIVVWKLTNVKSGDVFPVFVKIDDNRIYSNNFLFISTVLVILLVVFIIFRKRILERFSKFSNKEYDHLLDTEKKVIEELKKANRNELWQKEVQKLTGFSKAKVSRLVRNLEARNLVTKVPFGNTNKIRLN